MIFRLLLGINHTAVSRLTLFLRSSETSLCCLALSTGRLLTSKQGQYFTGDKISSIYHAEYLSDTLHCTVAWSLEWLEGPKEVTRRSSNVKNEQRYKAWIKLDITQSLERSLECQVTLYFYPHNIAVIQEIGRRQPKSGKDSHYPHPRRSYLVLVK